MSRPLPPDPWGPLTAGQRARATLAIAVALALTAGLFRSGVAMWRWAFTLRISFFSRDIVWMAPLGTALVLGVPAVGLAVLAAIAPRFVTLRSVLLFFGALATLSVVLLFGQVHDLAALLLAVGVGWRLADLGAIHPDRTAHLATRGTVALALLTLALGIGQRGSRPLREQWMTARQPPADSLAPNVVLIVLDAVRADHLSLYGYARPTTPALDRWARGGAVFAWAMAPSSWTLPSHEAMFTGRFPGELSGTFRQGLDDSYPTLAGVLRSRGYRAGGFAANPNYTTRESGLARGFTHYDASHPTLREIVLSATLMQSRVVRSLLESSDLADVLLAVAPPRFYMLPNLLHDPAPAEVPVRRFLRWQARLGGRPFFAFLNLYDAHAPYQPPGAWPRRFAGDSSPVARYDGAIAYEDSQVDTLLRTLERRGVLERTVVLVTADHGEQFGEHGLYFHNNGLFLPVLHVPLVMRYPARIPAGTRIEHPVSLRRIAATVLDLVGLPDTLLPGPTLATAWTTPSADTSSVRVQMRTAEGLPPWIPAGHGPMRGVISDRWHYIVDSDGRELLFAWRDDPDERRNLARTPEGLDVLPALRARAGTLPRSR